MEKKRATWNSRLTFILAAVGSSVGLGNAWRFPGLCAIHGGGAFLLVYVLLMCVFGIPLLHMEIAIGRKLKKGSPEAMRGMNKKTEPIGWAATTNAYLIAIYYAVVFGWVIMMALYSWKFATYTGSDAIEKASSLWVNLTKSADELNGKITGNGIMSTPVFVCVIIAWIFIWYCIRNGASSVSKVVKYTVSLPIICLVILAIRGFTMKGAGAGLKHLFVPKFSALSDPTLWADAAGQVFYSLSIMMAIMFAYGSFLKEDANIAVDGIIIALSDFGTSLLSGIVLFTTMYGCGLEIKSASGIATAFLYYPMAIVNLTNVGVLNAIFAFVFYFCLCTLAVDSAFSIIEGVSTALSDKFHLKPQKTTLTLCLIAVILSMAFVTGGGVGWLDIVDNWCNSYNLILVGILETIAIGWLFKPKKVLYEVNRNTKKFKMPAWWFITSIKFLAPVILTAMLGWNVFDLFSKKHGVYGGYKFWQNFVGGWLWTIVVFASGFIVKLVVKHLKKKGFVENEISWNDATYAEPLQPETVVEEVATEQKD